MNIRIRLWTDRSRALRAVVIVGLLLGALGPAAARAQTGAAPAAKIDCTGISAWYTAIIEPSAAIKQTTPASNLSLGDQYAFEATSNVNIVTQLKTVAVPAAATTAMKDLIAGYQSASDSANDWSMIESTTPYGSLPAFTPVYQAAVALSQAEHSLLTGYRERADLAAACGVGPGQAAATGDCAAVNAWMTVTQPVIAGFLDYDNQFNIDAEKRRVQGNADPSSITIGGLIAPWEDAADYTYLQGLTIAVVPAPAPATAVNQAIVDHLANWADLYSLGLLGVWAGFLGADATTSSQITSAYTSQTTAILSDYPKIQQEWATVAKGCNSNLALPNLPAPQDTTDGNG